jgi:hypothetical protein
MANLGMAAEPADARVQAMKALVQSSREPGGRLVSGWRDDVGQNQVRDKDADSCGCGCGCGFGV